MIYVVLLLDVHKYLYVYIYIYLCKWLNQGQQFWYLLVILYVNQRLQEWLSYSYSSSWYSKHLLYSIPYDPLILFSTGIKSFSHAAKLETQFLVKGPIWNECQSLKVTLGFISSLFSFLLQCAPLFFHYLLQL